MHFAISMTGMIAALTALFLVGCKPSTESSLMDIATVDSLKTGFFLPMIEEEYVYGVTPKIKTPEEFARRYGMELEKGKKVRYFVATSAQGESILVVDRNGVVGPAASIDAKGRKFLWDYVAKRVAKNVVKITALFIKYPLGETPKRWVKADGNDSNMFFVRKSKTQDGFSDPVLINWVDHLVTESGAILYRVGNVIFSAEGDLPAFKFRAVGNQVWELEGAYEDQDIGRGTVFWTPDRKTYYSLNPKNGRLVQWVRQDKDSMDRVGPVSRGSVKVPNIVMRTFEANRKSGLSLKGERVPFFGSDWLKMDRRTIPLVQTPGRLKISSKKSTSFGLTQAVAPEGKDFHEFFEPRVEDEGFNLSGLTRPQSHKGPIPGIPVYDPKVNYPANTVVQVEVPPKSGNYYEGRLPTAQTVTRNTGTVGWFFKDRIDTKHTTLEIAATDQSGQKVYSGYKLKFDNDMVVDQKKSVLDFTEHDQVYEVRDPRNFQWTTATADLEEQRAKTERYQTELTQRADELREMGQEQARLQERVEKKADAFYDHVSVKGATKHLTGKAVSNGFSKLAKSSDAVNKSFLDKAVENAALGFAEAATVEAAKTTVDVADAVVNGNEVDMNPSSYAGNLAGETAIQLLKSESGHKGLSRVTQGFSAGGTKTMLGEDDRSGREVVVDMAEQGAEAMNSMAWDGLGPLGVVGEYGTSGVIKGTVAMDAAAVQEAYQRQIDAKAMELSNLQNAGHPAYEQAAQKSVESVGRSWDDLVSQNSYESASTPAQPTYDAGAGPSSYDGASYGAGFGAGAAAGSAIDYAPAVDSAMDL